MDAVEDYARKWAKREKEQEIDTLSEWVKAVRSLIQARIRKLQGQMNTKAKSIFKAPDVVETLTNLHDKYVVVPADKAPNNIIFVCKRHYIDCLITELGIESNGNPTYTATTLSKEEIINNHKSVISSFGLNIKDASCDIPSLYWIPKLHKSPYKQRFIAGYASCTTKPLSKLLTSLLSAVKKGLQKYCDICYSTSGINQMWILKNSKDLMDILRSNTFSSCNSIKTYDFSTLYTTIPHEQLKTRLESIIRRSFFKSDGKRRYRYLVVGREEAYFVRDDSKSKEKYTEEDVIKMLQFLIDNIFVQFGGRMFQQTVGIPMGTNCAPLLADLFLYSFEAEFLDGLKKKDKHLARSFNFSFRYIDDVLSLNNARFGDYLHLIYPKELEIKDTTDTPTSASYLDLHLEIDSRGKLKTKLFDKRDSFNFPIVNFPFLSSNIPAAPAYGVYISQLIRFSRACDGYSDFLDRVRLLTGRLLNQGFSDSRLKLSLQKFYGRYHELVDRYDKSISQLKSDIFS